MEKEFVPYNLALRLKNLGFDIDYFGIYYPGLYEEYTLNCCHPNIFKEDKFKNDNWIKAPIFSQAFRWFREKHNLWCCIQKYPTSDNPNRCYYEIKGDNINTDKDEPENSYMSGWFSSHEEAELACLEKLIDLIESDAK